ncbi:MAG: efflux RND transporter periplasmic adaptor subunit, partial [Planctomycetota bacterium]
STAMLPSRAVRFDETGKAFVYLLSESNEVSITPITVGVDTGKQIEVTSGVAPGQLVIGPHLDRFTDGQLVTPM